MMLTGSLFLPLVPVQSAVSEIGLCRLFRPLAKSHSNSERRHQSAEHMQASLAFVEEQP